MKTLNQYIKESLLDDEDSLINDNSVLIKNFLEDNYKIQGSYIIKNNVVNIYGNIFVYNDGLDYLTNNLFTFGIINGAFDCSGSDILSLHGGPTYVKKMFNCCYCDNLINLDGSPKEVGAMTCSNCRSLKSLCGAPEKINGNFSCTKCHNLSSLDGMPKYIDGSFSFENCPKIKDLTPLKTANIKKNIYDTDGNCIYPNKLK